MDATTPYRRWPRVAGLCLLAAVGCQSTGAAPAARGQVPGAPPVAGQPVSPAASIHSGPVIPVGYSPASVQSPIGIPKTDPGPVLGDPRIKVVAIVGAGNIITDEEVWEAVRQRQEYRETFVKYVADERTAKQKELYDQELRHVIERELILDDMYARLKKSDKKGVVDEIKTFAGEAAEKHLRDYRRGMAKHLGQPDLPDEEFRSILRGQGLTAMVMKRQIERQIMADEYIRSSLKEKGKVIGFVEIREYYDKHPDEFRTSDKVRWQHAFIGEGRFPNRRAAYDYALTLQQKAANGENFEALVKALEPAGSPRQNFDGIGTKRGEIQPVDLEPTVWALQAGQVSGMIEAPAGYHVIKVIEREVSALRPFDQKVQADIRRKLTDQYHRQEYKRLVENLWWHGSVKVTEGQ